MYTVQHFLYFPVIVSGNGGGKFAGICVCSGLEFQLWRLQLLMAEKDLKYLIIVDTFFYFTLAHVNSFVQLLLNKSHIC